MFKQIIRNFVIRYGYRNEIILVVMRQKVNY